MRKPYYCWLAATFLLCGAQISFAFDKVLIMTISEYPRNQLPGVRHDEQNAMELARKLGYDTSSARLVKNQELTHGGMMQTLADFKRGVQENDRVFIYYSGHGASIQRNGRCEQSLVPIDTGPNGENLLSMAEINQELDEIKTRTSEALVVIDACHSGGLRDMTVIRGVGGKEVSTGGLSGKLWVPKSGESCQNPVNFAKQWEPIGGAARSMSNPENNFTFIAAANEREVALDDENRGGLATVALLDCVTRGVPDLDGSQGVSAKELAACAQKRIKADVPALNQKLGTHWVAHTVEVYGNTSQNLAAVKALPPPANAVQDAASRTIAAFQQIAAGSNGNWQITVTPTPSEVPLGGKVDFQYSTNQPGYVSVLYVGSDKKDIQALLSNKPVATTGHDSLGRTIISEPDGDNTFLVIFSQNRVDLDPVLKDGKVDMSANLLQNLQCATAANRSRNATKLLEVVSCVTKKRNASTFGDQSLGEISGYAARVVVVKGE